MFDWFKTPKQAPLAVTVYREPGTRDEYDPEPMKDSLVKDAAYMKALVKKRKQVQPKRRKTK